MKLILRNIKLTISYEGVHIERETKEGDITSSTYKWTKAISVKSDDHRYFLYYSKTRGIIIKKSPSNMNEDERYKFNALIKKYLKREGFNVN